MKVEVFDESGKLLEGEKGELVCTLPFPSMPVEFWNDEGDVKYKDAYFSRYPGVWRHGDYIRITEKGESSFMAEAMLHLTPVEYGLEPLKFTG